MKIYFVTSNRHKVEEAKKILDIEIEQVKLDIKEIQSLDVKEVVKDKAKEAYAKLKKPVIVEDTGLYIKGWNGFPGALISWVVKSMGIKKLCKTIGRKRSATAKACVAYYDGKNLKIFCGQIKGRISKKPRGKKRFDWDRIFIPEGDTRTFAEMSLEEKNRISHRVKAFRKFKRFLVR